MIEVIEVSKKFKEKEIFPWNATTCGRWITNLIRLAIFPFLIIGNNKTAVKKFHKNPESCYNEHNKKERKVKIKMIGMRRRRYERI